MEQCRDPGSRRSDPRKARRIDDVVTDAPTSQDASQLRPEPHQHGRVAGVAARAKTADVRPRARCGRLWAAGCYVPLPGLQRRRVRPSKRIVAADLLVSLVRQLRGSGPSVRNPMDPSPSGRPSTRHAPVHIRGSCVFRQLASKTAPNSGPLGLCHEDALSPSRRDGASRYIREKSSRGATV